jgi:IMP dehydrogenase
MLEDQLKEALFDDVLLVLVQRGDPAGYRRIARSRRRFRFECRSSARRWTPSPNRRPRSGWRREGGIGFIHKNLSIEDQAREVLRVKKAQSGIVVDPLTIAPSQTLEEALALMRHYRISGLPVVDADKRPVGILTNRDVRF